MADQELGLRFKTTSDVPEQVGKAKSSVVSFAKQVEDVQKKFSTAFKDIFLGFTAPMVILQNAIQAISAAIEKAKQDAKDGLDLIAKGETVFATSEEKKMAAFFKAKKETQREMELVQAGKSELAGEFLKTKEGQAIADKMAGEMVGKMAPGAQININALKESLKGDANFQKAALDAFLNSEEGKKFQPIFDAENNSTKAGTFKGPEGFSSVVGVGANPVLEKMTRQNEIMEEIKIILQEQFILNRNGTVPQPFTERVPLTMQKAGLS